MFNSVKLAASIVLVAMALPVMAEEMQCGGEYISGGQIEPLVKEQVVEKCGEPTSKDGFNWFYQEQGKILVFDGNGNLETIRDAKE